MKRIEFGYSNDLNPTGSFEGIGIKEGVLLTEADYYGAVEFEGNSYVIAKVTEDLYGRYPQLVGKFIVRPAIVDLYVDGSGTLFLDQTESSISQQIEYFINNDAIRDKIRGVDAICLYSQDLHKASKAFTIIGMDTEKVLSTSIMHEVFEEKNEALKRCHSSFSNLQSQLAASSYTR